MLVAVAPFVCVQPLTHQQLYNPTMASSGHHSQTTTHDMPRIHVASYVARARPARPIPMYHALGTHSMCRSTFNGTTTTGFMHYTHTTTGTRPYWHGSQYTYTTHAL